MDNCVPATGQDQGPGLGPSQTGTRKTLDNVSKEEFQEFFVNTGDTGGRKWVA